MSSQVDRVNIATRLRLLSSDFNNGERLNARAMLESISAYALGDVYKAAGLGVGGVIGGLTVRAITGTNTVEVSPGIALIPTVPAEPTYDPPVLWVELREAQTLNLTGLVDGGNPRLVTIEIEAAEVAKVIQARDVFDPTTGLFTVDPAVPVVIGSEPVLTATAGAAAITPVVASGTVGRLPLAIVKLTTGQAAFLDDYAPVLLCRPMLASLGDRLVPKDYVRGGGISVGEESGGAIGGLGLTTFNDASMNLVGLEARVAGRINFSSFGRTPDGKTPGTLSTATQPVYAYAAPPPWASDYGDIASREAWQRNPNEVDTAQNHSIIFGEGQTFTSLIAETVATPGLALRNAIVVWDNSSPYGIDDGLGGNAPKNVIDARGPHPDTAPGGAGFITLDDTQDPTWGTTQEVFETVYLGACSSIGTANFVAQATEGNGYVHVIDTVSFALMTGRRPARLDTVTTGALASFYPGHYPDMLVGDTDILPASATGIGVGVLFLTGSAGGTVSLSVADAFGYGAGSNAVAGGYRYSTDNTVNVNNNIDDAFSVRRDNTGAARWSLTAGVGTESRLFLLGYVDEILAAR